ncbi:MAG: hypothetical protein GY725_00075 [bacterium]|nr:hypothetical protein [bacterium]
MPSGEALLSLSPVFGLASYVIAHVGISRAFSARGMLFRAICGFAVGALAMLWINLEAPPELRLLNGLSYLALGFGYFNFVNLNFTSIRVRVLRELLECHPVPITNEQIRKNYGAGEILDSRLQRLTATGQLVRDGNRYRTGKGGVLLISRVFDLLIWLVKGSETRG